MQIKSDFAILDVKQGRAKLAKHFEKRPRMGVCPEDLRIPVTIAGYLDGQAGNDDGTSIEFSVHVDHVETEPLPKRINQFLVDCFGTDKVDPKKRVYRFLEEALELAQAMGITEEEADTLSHYVFNRPVGEVKQEYGGAAFTLASVGNVLGLDLVQAGHAAVDEAYSRIDRIREKDKTKPKVAA